MSSTSTSSSDRGGLSRRAHKVTRNARKMSDSDLLTSIGLGEVAQHFRDHPLDGPDIMGAVQRNVTMPTASSAPIQQSTAAAPAPGVRAPWFEGSKLDSSMTTPKAAPSKPASKPSFASALAKAADATLVQASLSPDGMLRVGTPGEPAADYLSAVDEVFSLPPGQFTV